jgi:hypothetical protein
MRFGVYNYIWKYNDIDTNLNQKNKKNPKLVRYKSIYLTYISIFFSLSITCMH